jgi:hypothetical protein
VRRACRRKESRAEQRDLLLEAGRGVVLDELDRTPPAKKAYAQVGLIEAISVSSAWNSTFGKGTNSSFSTFPPPFSKLSLKPPIDCSPAAYFQVIVTAVLYPFSAATMPMASPGCELENETRKMFGAHSGPVASSTPALGMISSVLLSRAAFTIAICTPEWTVPTMTSTLSRLMSLLTLSAPFAGSDSSTTVTYSSTRPPSLPPCSLT